MDKYKQKLIHALSDINTDGEVVRWIERNFPELRESEDERMLREFNDFLCEEIEWRTNDVRDEKDRRTLNMLCYVLGKVKARLEKQKDNKFVPRVLPCSAAWFEDGEEKQKENPKSADSIPADCVSDVKCENRWHKVQDSLPDNGRLVLAQDCLGNTLLARYDGEGNWEVSVYDNEDYYCRNTITKWCEIPSEKQKEQKPVDLPPGFYFIDPDGNKYYSKEFRFDDIKMKVVEKEQKPAVSREEILYQLLQNSSITMSDYLYLTNKQKPAEWSKEDETAFGDLMWCVEQARKSAKDENDMGNIWFAENWLENRLKSIRPSWKPSEEQMSMLLAVINDPNNAGSESCHLALISIYEQLKKL